MGIDQPKVSALLNGRLANFSTDRLMRLLTALGQDVEIVGTVETSQSASAQRRQAANVGTSPEGHRRRGIPA
jgi:hypothetical protein